MNNLGERLKSRLKEVGRRQVDLAAACHMTESGISQLIKNGNRTMAGQNLARAAEYLGVNAIWLAEGKGEKLKTQQKNVEEGFALVKNDASTMIPNINRIMGRLSLKRQTLVLLFALDQDYEQNAEHADKAPSIANPFLNSRKEEA
jgi:transcriptional regulator with XRE-family HTH domain